MITSETLVGIPLGDVTPSTSEAAAMVTALEQTYAVSDSNVDVTVTLKQKLSVDAAVLTSLGATTQCTVLIDALGATSLGATCVATAGATYTTFALAYPITGPGIVTTTVNAKTAAIKSQVGAATFPAEMSTAAASYRRRRLADMTISDVQTPVTEVEAEVSIVASVAAADSGASAALAALVATTASTVAGVDTSTVSTALAATGVSGLNVQDAVVSTIVNNAPPSSPQPVSPPATPPPPPSPPLSPVVVASPPPAASPPPPSPAVVASPPPAAASPPPATASPAGPPPAAPATSDDSSSDSPIGIIAGAGGGGLAFVLIVAAAVWYTQCRGGDKKGANDNYAKNNNQDANPDLPSQNV